MEIPSCQEWLNDDYWTDPPAYIHQLLPREPGEYMIICGRPAIGKTNLAMHMACCLATGLSFFGFECEMTKVGHLIMEGSKKNIRDRFKKILPQYPSEERTRNYFVERREPLDLEKNLDRYAMMFDGCQVVILDNLKHVTNSRYLENAYALHWIKEVYQKFLRRIGAVGILTHHLSKTNDLLIEPDDLRRVKGAGEYVEEGNTVLLLERRKQGRGLNGKFSNVDETKLVLYFSKARIAEDVILPVNLIRNFELCRFDRDGDGD